MSDSGQKAERNANDKYQAHRFQLGTIPLAHGPETRMSH